MNYKKRFGQEGETAVTKYLEEREYEILAKNFSINHKIGEIDIIAKKDSLIIFVEVKTRAKDDTVLVCEMVSRIKQKKIILMAKFFLQKEKIDIEKYILRFDIAIVIKNKINYFDNAFTSSE
jgi:putative endonuclease